MANLAAVLLISGCTVVSPGTARPSLGLAPRPVVGEPVKQILPNKEQLQKLLGQSFSQHPSFAPRWGINEMPDANRSDADASPYDCVGVTFMAQKSIYSGSKMHDFAFKYWAADDESVKVGRVMVAVVALRSSADADALFTKFSQQWQRCQGTSVVSHHADPEGIDKITGVQNSDSVLAAAVQDVDSGTGRILPWARSLGVRVNCIAEVQLIFFPGYDSPGVAGTGSPDTSAIAITRTMMDKVSELS